VDGRYRFTLYRRLLGILTRLTGRQRCPALLFTAS
jgi:hypothetical protein